MRTAGYAWLVFLALLCGCERQPVDVDAALHRAAGSGRLSEVRALLARGADVNARDYRGWTPLHLAARQGHAGMVELLLKHGADPDVQGGAEGPALHSAIFFGHPATVRKLIEGGANVNLWDTDPRSFNRGKAPLHCVFWMMGSAYRGAMADMLLAAGADPDVPTDAGDTALHQAAARGLTEVVKTLLAYGASVNARNAKGSTCLHEAVWVGCIETVTVLLGHGADINSADQVGDTPLHVAACNGYVELCDLLRQKGADLEAKNDLGQTPLDCLRSPDEPNMVILHADGQRPYEVILTLPTTVRSFLIDHGIEFDRVWTPEGNDIAALDLEAAIKAADHIATRSWFSINYVLEHLSRYHREYGGFLAAGRRYLLCNMNYTHVDETPTDKFTWGMDGACALVRIVVDLENNVVVRIDCN